MQRYQNLEEDFVDNCITFLLYIQERKNHYFQQRMAFYYFKIMFGTVIRAVSSLMIKIISSGHALIRCANKKTIVDCKKNFILHPQQYIMLFITQQSGKSSIYCKVHFISLILPTSNLFYLCSNYCPRKICVFIETSKVPIVFYIGR